MEVVFNSSAFPAKFKRVYVERESILTGERGESILTGEQILALARKAFSPETVKAVISKGRRVNADGMYRIDEHFTVTFPTIYDQRGARIRELETIHETLIKQLSSLHEEMKRTTTELEEVGKQLLAETKVSGDAAPSSAGGRVRHKW